MIRDVESGAHVSGLVTFSATRFWFGSPVNSGEQCTQEDDEQYKWVVSSITIPFAGFVGVRESCPM